MKLKFIRAERNRRNKKNGEKGQALIMVLVLLLLVTIIVTSMLSFAVVSRTTNGVYNNNASSFYAAEAGIQDGEYNVLNQSDSGLNTLFSDTLNGSYNNPLYNDYDYEDTWSYTVPNQTNNNQAAQVNGYTVSVKLQNAWVPLIDNNDLTFVPTTADPTPPGGTFFPPSSSEANNIISDVNLVVAGGVTTPQTNTNHVGTYQLNINYKGSLSLPIISIGVWLPQGFTYNLGSSNLQTKSQQFYSTEQLLRCAGNEAVIWSFPSGTTFSSLQTDLGQEGTNGINQVSMGITFTYSTSLTSLPDAIGWLTDTANPSNSLWPYSYAWDADIKDCELTSNAGNMQIQAYVPKASMRALGTAINGDYLAIGNSLMVMGTGETQSNDPENLRYSSLPSSSAIANSIPSDAKVTGAFLYWTGWFPSETSQPMGPSYGEEVDFEIEVNGITNYVYFNSSGNPAEGTSASDYISCTSPQTDSDPSVTGYSYSCYKDVTALLQNYAPNGGDASTPVTYTVAPAPNCTLGFNASTAGLNNTQQQGCYDGWSLVIIYTSPETLGHQLFLYDTFQNGASNSDIDITDKTSGPGGTISGFIVPPEDPNAQDTEPSQPNYDPAATITAFVGEGDWCYTGDFLAFNDPTQPSSTSAAQNIPNSYRLWDGISSVPDNTATAPDNVWNSNPQTATSQEYNSTTGKYNTYTLPQYQPNTQDGVDIKTFVILWESGLLNQGATSVRIDLPTQTDQWNFVYMILSFRSSVTIGGSVSYLVTQTGK